MIERSDVPLLSTFGSPTECANPPDSASSAKRLNQGNADFAAWIARQFRCNDELTHDFETITGLASPDTAGKQSPFGVVVSCSDARFPVRVALGQRVNNLFEIRVAGNVLSNESSGSVEYALQHLPSVKSVVVLGHTDCDVMGAAVDAFHRPATLNDRQNTSGLRAIIRHLLGPIVLSAAALKRVMHRFESNSLSHRRRLLVEAGAYIQAASAALELHRAVVASGRRDVEVTFGVIDLMDYVVRSTHYNGAASRQLQQGLSSAPSDVEELEELAHNIAAAIANH